MYYRFFYAFIMLTIPYIRDNKELVLKGLEIKNFDAPELIDQILAVDNERRSLQVKTNELQSEMNRLSPRPSVMFGSLRARVSRISPQPLVMKRFTPFSRHTAAYSS